MLMKADLNLNFELKKFYQNLLKSINNVLNKINPNQLRDDFSHDSLIIMLLLG